MRLIESDRNIGLVERPEYKRRWNAALWEALEKAALRSWLLDRLEDPRYWLGDPRLTSVANLADATRLDADFMQVAEIYTGRGDFDAAALVAQLVESESVPFLPVLRYAESGLRKRAEWEACWEKQRREDAIDAQVTVELKREEGESEENYAKWLATEQRRRKAAEIGDIPVPPKYKSSDFLSTTLLEAPRRLGCAQGAVRELLTLRPRCRRLAARCLGRLGSPAAGHGTRHLLLQHERQRRLGARALEATPRRDLGACVLAQAMAQRVRPRARHVHGRLLRVVRHRRGAGPRLHPGRPKGVEADRDRTEPGEAGTLTPRVNSP